MCTSDKCFSCFFAFVVQLLLNICICGMFLNNVEACFKNDAVIDLLTINANDFAV